MLTLPKNLTDQQRQAAKEKLAGVDDLQIALRVDVTSRTVRGKVEYDVTVVDSVVLYNNEWVDIKVQSNCDLKFNPEDVDEDGTLFLSLSTKSYGLQRFKGVEGLYLYPKAGKLIAEKVR